MTPLTFHPSKDSEAARLRKWLWAGAAVAAAVMLVAGRGQVPAVVSALSMLAIVAAIDLAGPRRQLHGGAYASLDEDGFESRAFHGKPKRFAWSEIAEALVVSRGSSKSLELRLRDGSAKPSLPLAGLSAPDQQALLEAIATRLGQPIEDHAARERGRLAALGPTPWATYSLIALNVLVWLCTLLLGLGFEKASTEGLLNLGANSAWPVQHGEPWRLFTSMFLHGSPMHLAFNMLGLWSLGVLLERVLGWRLFLLLYVAAGLLGSAASLHFSAQQGVSVGASGAIFGVAGAVLVLVRRLRRELPHMFNAQAWVQVALFVFYSLAQGFARHNVDNAAHVGGLLAGATLAALLPTRLDAEGFARTAKRRGLQAAVLALACLAAVMAAAPRSSVDPRLVFASERAMVQAFTMFDASLRLMARESEEVKAGRMSELELDRRSRSVHAPALRAVREQFEKVRLPESDPRTPIARDGARLAALLHELAAMDSVVADGKPVPVDPERAGSLEAEATRLNADMKRSIEQLKRK